MNQRDRDRLVTVKAVKKKQMKERDAAKALQVSVRQVQRLVRGLKTRGDKVVVHGLRGVASKRRIAAEIERQAVQILSGETYRGFGPTLASEHLARQHDIGVSRETVRKWMSQAGLWKAGRSRIEQIHEWRPRRSRWGELVQWDTSEHDWLEGRGGEGQLYLIAMIDDATSRVLARFVLSDSTEANLAVLELWLRQYGRPLTYYTDKAGLFQTAHKTKRDEQREGKDREPLPPTQIGRALKELNIAWVGAHSPQAKGRIERFFGTAQDRLVKEMRAAGVPSLEQANVYLEKTFLPWWDQTLAVVPAQPEDAHRPLEPAQDLAAILSHVESRQVKNDYTIQFEGKVYGIERADIVTGLRGASVRVEKRRDGSLAIRFRDRYLRHQLCEPSQPVAPAPRPAAKAGARKGPNAGGKSGWMKGFLKTPGPSLGKAIAISNATS